MPVQTFLIAARAGVGAEGLEAIGRFVNQRNGFILLATPRGTIIAAFDDAHLDALKAHHLVQFVGGVTLDPASPAAAALHKVFAANVARQLGIQLPGPGNR